MTSLVSDPSLKVSPPFAVKVSDKEVKAIESQIEVKLQIPSTPAAIPASSAPTYAERFKASLRNLRKISDPTYLEDGTPVVQAPPAILLQASEMWKDHLVAHFHGRRPHPTKIIADLNPVWGKFGNISVRTLSSTSCLIYIPSVQTREWVLQVGYWQVDHCGFSVYKWSAEGNFQDEDLRTAPTWVVLKSIPPQLYSLDGISVVASAIGEPLHTEKSRLDPYHFGDTKVKVEVTLDNDPPKLVEVRDVQGNAVRIRAEYPNLPPKCLNCERYGHLINRCLKPLVKKKKERVLEAPEETMVSTSTKINLISGQVDVTPPEEGEIVEGEREAQVKSSQIIPTENLKKSKKKKKAKKAGISIPSGTLVPSSSVSAQIDEVVPVDVPENALIQDCANTKVSLVPNPSPELAVEENAIPEGKKVPCNKLLPSDPESFLETEEQEVQEEELHVHQDVDPEEDDRLWFKHPKAVRRALRQEALWKTSLLKAPPKNDFSFRTRGFSSGKKSPL